MPDGPKALPHSCDTAFLVIRDYDGEWLATPDLTTKIACERTATVTDMRQGCQEITSDIDASKVAAIVHAYLNDELIAAREQAAKDSLLARLSRN